MSKKISISLCMITLNEEKYLKKALKNVSPFVDEIVIVDGGSTDRTAEIARQFGAKVIYHKWGNQFCQTKKHSYKACKRKLDFVYGC